MQKLHSEWRSFKRVPASFMPRDWQDWVLDRGSLTKRLQRASQGDFRVEVLRQGFMIPNLSERRALDITTRRVALVREVELICRGVCWVRARSVIPVDTLSGEERQLRYLRSKPLGAFLFASRSMRRGPIQLARGLGIGTAEMSFARRSVFRLHNKPLLVMEHFCPPVLKA